MPLNNETKPNQTHTHSKQAKYHLRFIAEKCEYIREEAAFRSEMSTIWFEINYNPAGALRICGNDTLAPKLHQIPDS